MDRFTEMESKMDDNYISTELQKFSITDSAIAELKDSYIHLLINGVGDKNGYANVKNARAHMKSVRLDVEKKRKDLKEDSLKFGRAVDKEAKRITTLLMEVESHLEAQMTTIDKEIARLEREEHEAKMKKVQDRVSSLSRVGAHIDLAVVSKMNDEDFTTLLNSSTEQFNEQQRIIKANTDKLKELSSHELPSLQEKKTYPHLNFENCGEGMNIAPYNSGLVYSETEISTLGEFCQYLLISLKRDHANILEYMIEGSPKKIRNFYTLKGDKLCQTQF